MLFELFFFKNKVKNKANNKVNKKAKNTVNRIRLKNEVKKDEKNRMVRLVEVLLFGRSKLTGDELAPICFSLHLDQLYLMT